MRASKSPGIDWESPPSHGRIHPNTMKHDFAIRTFAMTYNTEEAMLLFEIYVRARTKLL